ncbi:bifunctional DNA primase/polymerase [Solwaraspora sp. WMMA2056]|uniref:bifunctional DNA primase/polymerase n=1 Tax=Solwaraspora sp. WMMA2056 TaxID=3015161 RepID=UPI00259B18C9|nr:bifunctional DNA primase/polymerase [Solwaraspora sp. WMMA2056]WJK43553.1 bifunctional DNA primase/polymerase [Solwaraspora sp. WMMA2056]
MRWTVQPPSFGRLRLRRAALRYAAHGWPVTPGAVLCKGRFRCDRLSCPILGCHPAQETWERDASDRPDRVSAWWRTRPHPVLLATGHAFDVLDVPARLGLRVLCTLRLRGGAAMPGQGQLRGPVAVTPTGRWMFLVRPGDTLRPELDDSLDVIQHGSGSWIPAPPTLLPEGPVRWAVGPQEVGWYLPHSYAVQQLVVDARELAAPAVPVPRLPRPRTAPAGAVTAPPPVAAHVPVAVPRQVSTLRRAL